ncbi:MAG: ribulose-phosphate 3-epimerase, partial [Chitinivibrionales bacterium]|nr:ribulose-phosphate 3-epimerase [Chitinivibrionales bacterium]
VLIMTVYAGFGGQKFIREMLPKMRRVYDEACASGHDLDIQVDGGINHETAQDCAEYGANVFVAGNYIFGAENYAQRIKALQSSVKNGAAMCK